MAVLPPAPAVAQSDRSPAPEPQGAPSDSAASTQDHDGRGTSITTEDEGPDRHRRGTTRGHDEPQRRAAYADVGITDSMPGPGLCRVQGRHGLFARPGINFTLVNSA